MAGAALPSPVFSHLCRLSQEREWVVAERGDRADGNTAHLGKWDEHGKVDADGKKKNLRTSVELCFPVPTLHTAYSVLS